MKARIKATGEIIEVSVIGTLNGNRYRRTDGQNELYESKDLDLNIETIINPDYWVSLEHQYAGMAMQGILACEEWKISPREGVSFAGEVALQAQEIAHALVEKMKEEK